MHSLLNSALCLGKKTRIATDVQHENGARNANLCVPRSHREHFEHSALDPLEERGSSAAARISSWSRRNRRDAALIDRTANEQRAESAREELRLQHFQIDRAIESWTVQVPRSSCSHLNQIHDSCSKRYLFLYISIELIWIESVASPNILKAK